MKLEKQIDSEDYISARETLDRFRKMMELIKKYPIKAGIEKLPYIPYATNNRLY